MKRRICLLVLISVLTAGAFPPPAAAAAEERFPAVRVYEGQFRDVSDSDWYYENIKALYELGLVNGQEDGTFGPEGNMSVAEVVTTAAQPLRGGGQRGRPGPLRRGQLVPALCVLPPVPGRDRPGVRGELQPGGDQGGDGPYSEQDPAP